MQSTTEIIYFKNTPAPSPPGDRMVATKLFGYTYEVSTSITYITSLGYVQLQIYSAQNKFQIINVLRDNKTVIWDIIRLSYIIIVKTNPEL